MLNYLKKEADKTTTENGAATYSTTQSDCLDLFSTVGALRSADAAEIVNRFVRAYCENAELAMKILFYARDVRGGVGERRVFRILLKYLAETNSDVIIKNIENIPEYGRFDDILILLDTPCRKTVINYIAGQLKKDTAAMEKNESISLLSKWLPSVNTSNTETVKQAKQLAKALDLKECVYRKMLSKLRAYQRILENNLRVKDYTFDYEKQPSKAMYKYRKAFIRNDNERYIKFLDRVEEGSAVLKTGTLFPYEIIRPYVNPHGDFSANMSKEVKRSADVTWRSLPDYTNGENALVVVDGSGSMYTNTNPRPCDVAISLGIYFAERNQGAFHNHFITFSENPRLIEIKGKDIVEKASYCVSFNEVANTNIQRVFKLVLNTAVKYHLSQSELPKTIYIISDMEFDRCANDSKITNFGSAKKLFEEHNYQLPQLVFWNVASRNLQQPVQMNQQGVVLVSGCSPKVFEMAVSGVITPYQHMLDVLSSERYEKVIS